MSKGIVAEPKFVAFQYLDLNDQVVSGLVSRWFSVNALFNPAGVAASGQAIYTVEPVVGEPTVAICSNLKYKVAINYN